MEVSFFICSTKFYKNALFKVLRHWHFTLRQAWALTVDFLEILQINGHQPKRGLETLC